MNLNRFTRALAELDTMYVFSHFTSDVASAELTTTATDSGTAAVGDTAGGVLLLTPSDGTVADNDEVYVQTANELFLFAANKAIYGRARIKWVETSAGIYNVAFGFMNAPTANAIIDDGGGVKVSGSTLAIYKVDGESVFRCASACNGTSTVTKSNKSAVGATWYELEIICNDWDGVSMEVSFKVDGEYLKDANNVVIKHTVLIASATEMAMFVGAKLGAATNNDTTSVDYWYGAGGIAA
jgi:hypothetical protein